MTVSLYMGMNNILSVRFPSPAKVEILSTNEETEQQVRQIIKDEAEKAGVTADMSVSDICDAMKTAMTEISYDGLTGEGMTWTADGEPDKAPKAVVIKDGVYTAM